MLPSRKSSNPKLRTACTGVRELTERSNIHGLNHIFPSPSIIWRLIWTVLWLLGMAGFIYSVHSLVENYNRKPITTKQTVDFEPFKWPDITFCNHMASYNLESSERESQWTAYNQRAATIGQHLPLDLFDLVYSDRAVETRQFSLVQSTVDPKTFGVGVADEWLPVMAVNYRQDGIKLIHENYDNMRPYTENLLPVIYASLRPDRFSVPCYTLQLSKLTSDPLANDIDTVLFHLDYHHKSYLLMNLSSAERYITVSVTPPDTVTEVEPIVLEPGYYATVAVDMLRTRREMTSKRCRTTPHFSVELFQADLVHTHRLSGPVSLCHQVAAARLYLKHCACYNPYLPFPVLTKEEQQAFNISTKLASVRQPNLCLNMDLYNQSQLAANINCMKDVFQRYSTEAAYNAVSWTQECLRIDPLPACDDITYPVTTIRNLQFFGYDNNSVHDAYRAIIRSAAESYTKDSNLTAAERETYLQYNAGAFQIHRRRPFGGLVEENLQFTVTSLLSDLGGQMGLWLGISVMALFEIIEFLGPLVAFLIQKMKDRPDGDEKIPEVDKGSRDSFAG